MAAEDEGTPTHWLAQVLSAGADGVSVRWSEHERLAVDVMRMVSACLATPDRESLALLRKAKEALYAKPETHEARRARCVEEIRAIGSLWSAADNEDRARLLHVLAWNLSTTDDKIRDAFGDALRAPGPPPEGSLAWLSAKLDRYDPSARSKSGRIGAETLLAELIVNDFEAGALGFKLKDGESAEKAIDRIRRMLANDVKKIFPTLK